MVGVRLNRHSGPQGRVVPQTIIDDPADWRASDWEGREAEYTYAFTPGDLAELRAAVAALEARGVASEDDIIAVRASIIFDAVCRANMHLSTLYPCLPGTCAQEAGRMKCCRHVAKPKHCHGRHAVSVPICGIGSKHLGGAALVTYLRLPAADQGRLRAAHAGPQAGGARQGGDPGPRLPAPHVRPRRFCMCMCLRSVRSCRAALGH